MADPTRAELRTQLQNVVHILEETRKFAKDNAENFIGLQDTYTQSMESDFAGPALAVVDQARSGINSVLSGGFSLVGPIIQAWGKLIKAPETDVLSILSRMYDDFIDEPERVTSRQFTYGTPVADGGNTGDGSILRLNKDVEDFDIENQTPDTAKEVFFTADAHTGAERNQESYQIRGGFGGIDALDVEGVGRTATFDARSSLDSPTENSGFDSIAGTESVPTDIPGWTVLTQAGAPLTVNGTNFGFDSTNIYLPAPDGNTTVRSLILKASDVRLEQKLADKGIDLDFGRPYYMQLAFNREVNAATGTLEIFMGTTTASVVMAAQTGWNLITLTLDKNLWHKNFKKNDLDIRIEWTGTGGTGLLIDDMTFVPWDFFDGGWYLGMPGRTSWLRRDKFTWSDTVVESIIQRWLWLAFGIYLPHTTGGGVTITDP